MRETYSLFEPVIIPLRGADPLERPAPGKPGPVPGLYHASGVSKHIVIYVPGGVSGAPLSGRHDYEALAAGLRSANHSLLVIQALTAQRPAFLPFTSCEGDIGAAISWARDQGYEHLVLAGNGLGATRAAYWASKNPKDIIPLILLSAFESPYRASLETQTPAETSAREALLETCRGLVRQGQGEEVVDIALPSGRRAMAAAAVLDIFGGPREANTALSGFGHGVQGPICLIYGERDPYLGDDGMEVVSRCLANASLTKTVIAGVGHELLTEPGSIRSTVDAIVQGLQHRSDRAAPIHPRRNSVSHAAAANQFDLAAARFEVHNLALLSPDPVEAPRFALPPVPVLLHRSSRPTRRLAVYVQAGIIGAPLTGRHDYRPLALALDAIDCSLLVTQSAAARRTELIKFDTCVNDVRTAIEWAKTGGFDEILLIGVSMGGPRVAFWNAVAPDAAVKAIIFMSAVDSAYLGNARNWTPEQKQHQDDILQLCRDRISAGRGDEIITGELMGRPFPMSAEAYLSYFGQLDEMNASALKFAAQISVPTLVIHATEDVGCPAAGAQDVFDAMTSVPEKDLFWVEGADHQLMAPGWSLDVVTTKITDFAARHLR